MEPLPANLGLTRVVLVPAELGGVPFWAVYERLDRSEMIHAVYRGVLGGIPGESREALLIRAAAVLAGRE